MKQDKVQDIIDLMRKLNTEEKDRLATRLSQLEREKEIQSLLETIVREAQECLNKKRYCDSGSLSITAETIERTAREIQEYC